MIKVENMKSKTSGKPIANQFLIEMKQGETLTRVFQSYNSCIAMVVYENEQKRVFLDGRYWDHSPTTSKWRNVFLNETTKETQKKINEGIYSLVNLNNEA